MKTLYESILDDEEKLIGDIKQHMKDEVCRRNIEKLAHEMYVKFDFDPYTGTLEEIEGKTPEEAIEMLRSVPLYAWDFNNDDLISLIKSSQWKKYKKELEKSNLKYKEALIEDANRIEEYIRKNK